MRRLALRLWNWLLDVPFAVRDGLGLARRRSARMLWIFRDAAADAPFVLRDRLTTLRRVRGVVLIAAVPLLPAIAASLVLTGRQADSATAAAPAAYRVVPDRPPPPAVTRAVKPKASPEPVPKARPKPVVRAKPTPPSPVVERLVAEPTVTMTQVTSQPAARVAPRVRKAAAEPTKAEPKRAVPAEPAAPAAPPTHTVPAETVPAAPPAAVPAAVQAVVPNEEPHERHGRRGHDRDEDEERKHNGKGKDNGNDEDEDEHEGDDDDDDEDD